jgi:hypothetical protein
LVAPAEVLPLSCPVCSVRKEKRFCLALHDRICPQCCGEQREVTLDCPSECPYLQQARQHEKPRETPENLPDEMFSAITVERDAVERNEAFIAGILQALASRTRADRDLRDRDLIGAVTRIARTYQTLTSSGLFYQEALPNPLQQGIVDMLEQLIEEFRGMEQEHRGYTALKDRDVLTALVIVLRLAHLQTSGRPLSRAFIGALCDQFSQPATALDGSSEAASRIIIP